MAYLKSLVVAGGSRFLNKIYANEIDVSGAFGVSGNMTVGGTLGVTGASTFGGAVSVSGASSFSNSVSITGTLTLSKTTDVSGTANNGPALVVGGVATSTHMEICKNKIQAKTTGTTVANMSINPDGGLVTIGSGGLTVTGTSTFGTANITNGNASSMTVTNSTANNLNVIDVLRASRYDLQSVSQLGGAFYVSPTISFPNSETTFTITIANGYVTIVISDSSITSTEIAGVVWAANAKVKASGKIGDVTTGTMSGTVTAINTTAHTLTIRVSGENSSAVVAGTYTASQISDFSIMLYETSDSKPVGIILNSYGTNNLAYIDIYGGSSTTPNVRIGNLGGLSFNDETLSNQWGIYTNNGYYSGKIIANGGLIGGFEIGSDSIHTSGVLVTSNAANSVALSSGTFSRTINGTSRSSLKLALGSNFGVSSTGILYAGSAIISGTLTSSSGTIGGWTLDSNALKIGTFGQENSALLCTGSSTAKSIGGSASISGWTFTSGANFGVTKTGALYASDATIAGLITTNSITASGGELNIIDPNNASCATINTNGMIIYKDDTQVASFGSESIIGLESSKNIEIDSNGISIQNGSIGLAIFGGDGCTIGSENSSRITVTNAGLIGTAENGVETIKININESSGNKEIIETSKIIVNNNDTSYSLYGVYETFNTPISGSQILFNCSYTAEYNGIVVSDIKAFELSYTYDPENGSYLYNGITGTSFPFWRYVEDVSVEATIYYGEREHKASYSISSNNTSVKILSMIISATITVDSPALPSFSFGSRVGANGAYSVTSGESLYATQDFQTCLGKYNLEDTNNDYALIIGNGNTNDNRSNAVNFGWSGDIECFIDTTATSGTVDGDLYAAIESLGWENEVIV